MCTLPPPTGISSIQNWLDIFSDPLSLLMCFFMHPSFHLSLYLSSSVSFWQHSKNECSAGGWGLRGGDVHA